MKELPNTVSTHDPKFDVRERSGRFSLSAADWKSFMWGLLDAALGGIATFLTTTVIPGLSDSPEWMVIVASTLIAGIKLVRKWIMGPPSPPPNLL